ncbi:MAG: FliH/SctL family protein [Pseudomonadota bacterium]
MSGDPGAARWRLPELAASRSGAGLADIEAIERAAGEEGFRRGFSEGRTQGLAQAQADIRRLLAQLEGLIESLARPMAAFDRELEAAMAELAVQVAGVLVGQAYEADPELLAGLVQRAVRAAMPGARDVCVRMHPEDLAAVTPLLPANEPVLTRLEPDTTLTRGDVRVHTEALRLDGTLATRLQVMLASLRPAAEAE